MKWQRRGVNNQVFTCGFFTITRVNGGWKLFHKTTLLSDTCKTLKEAKAEAAKMLCN